MFVINKITVRTLRLLNKQPQILSNSKNRIQSKEKCVAFRSIALQECGTQNIVFNIEKSMKPRGGEHFSKCFNTTCLLIF